MPLKLACADFAFPLLPHEQALDQLLVALDTDASVFVDELPDSETRKSKKKAAAASNKARPRTRHLWAFGVSATDTWEAYLLRRSR